MKKINIQILILYFLLLTLGQVLPQAQAQTKTQLQAQGKIVFTKNREIHIIEPNGKNLAQLTDYEVPGHRPISLSSSVSKAGQIGYIYDPVNHGYMSTYKMNLNGSNKIRVSKEPSSNNSSTWGSTISPDGKYFVFQSTISNNIEIYRMNSDGSNVINISHTLRDDYFPKWSPDSNKIIFSTSNSSGGTDIVTTDINGNNKTLLIQSDRKLINVAISKDGRKIAYSDSKSNSSDLWIADIDGRNANKIKTVNKWTNLSFSPDSQQITFVSVTGKISIIDIDGSGYKELTKGVRPVWTFN